MNDWLPISTAPRGGANAKFLVTNNIAARGVHGHMSHAWLVDMIHDAGCEVVAFKEDGYSKIYGITHWLPVTALAAATGTAKTPQAVECEASQSGPKGNAQ